MITGTGLVLDPKSHLLICVDLWHNC